MIDQPFNPEKLNQLRAWMRDAKRVIIAYSGGVDSSLMLRVASEELEQEALGIMAVSASPTRWRAATSGGIGASHGCPTEAAAHARD